MTLAFGIYHPDLVGDLVIVSSAPFLPALSTRAGISVDSATTIGRMIKKGMEGQSSAQVKQSTHYYLATMMRDTSRMAEVLDMSVR